jgi:uncharacterized protein YjeT (DUF2065 family)
MRTIRQLPGPVFVLAGTLHLVIPKLYRRMVQGAIVAWVIAAMRR